MTLKQKAGTGGFRGDSSGKSGGKSGGKFEIRDFFRIGEQLGIPWFRLYLADSLAGKYGKTGTGGLLRWLILHLAVQAGSGHLRSSLENIEEEMRAWYSPGSSPLKEFNETLPAELGRAVPALIEAGLDSGLIGQLPGENSPGEILAIPRPPLVLTSDRSYLYFLRRRKEEDRFLAALESRSLPSDEVNRPDLKHTVHPAFTAASGSPGSPEEALLRGLAAGRRLILLAGGPGTGKTTTVARLLELLNPRPGNLEVLLAAPTGRAAARMSESLNLSGDTVGRTIHSLLGIYPGRPPRHDADRPLAADLCIVDEASMVDLPLMNALLAALPESAVLLLVGDPDQLPSVEAGAVLGDLLYGAAEAAGLVGGGGAASDDAPLRSGGSVTGRRAPRRKSPLSGSVVKLTKVYRSDTAILEAASAVRDGDFEALKKILGKTAGAVRLHPPGRPDAMARVIAQEFRESTALAAQPVSLAGDEDADSVSDELQGLFKDFSSRAVLSPLRRGLRGVPAMNERIAWLLGGKASPFPGMPVMITRNDPDRKLWNGDRGILVSLDGKLRAAFPEAGGGRSFPLAALPGWEPAWVQTIHKSQGSEFDSVTILLPEEAERFLSREILYTAFTRARHTVNLYAELETVKAALERRVVRHSRIRNWAAGR